MNNPYLTPARVKAALRALELRPTRGMGQNFLVDPEALRTIVAAGELAPGDAVLEIGPGLGVLTWELLRAAGRVVAVELDRRLAARLREEFQGERRLTIVQGDILKLEPGALVETGDSSLGIGAESLVDSRPLQGVTGSPISNLQPQRYKVVANLPYAITSPVLRHLLEAEARPELIVVLVQWEVAQRIAARPGDLSVLAHSVQIYAEPEVIARVPASSFIPAPQVDSAVLRLRVRPRPAIEVDSVDRLMRLIKAGFLQARKQLGNALPSGLAAMGRRMERERVLAALHAAGVDPTRRAETLSLQEWAAVYRALGG